MLVAAEGGVHVPPVVVAGKAGPTAAVLVQRPVGGRRLSDVDPDTITDALLVDLWTDAAALDAPGSCTASSTPTTSSSPAAVRGSSPSTTPRSPVIPTAARPTSPSSWRRRPRLVGDERAVRAAFAVLGGPPLARALPFLQPAAALRRDPQAGGRTPAFLREPARRAARHRGDRHRDRPAPARPGAPHHRDERGDGGGRARRGRRAPRRRRRSRRRGVDARWRGSGDGSPWPWWCRWPPTSRTRWRCRAPSPSACR